MKTGTIVILALFAALTSSCKLTNPEPDASWTQREVEAPSDRVLWKLALLSVQDADFPLTGDLDRHEGEIKTGWKTNLQPVSRKGYRTRALVEMEPASPGVWNVKARVQKQFNMAMVAPLDPQRADWKWAPDDDVAATIILQKIVSMLDPAFELTPEEKDPLDQLMERVEEIEENE